jgi:hypothetical protein
MYVRSNRQPWYGRIAADRLSELRALVPACWPGGATRVFRRHYQRLTQAALRAARGTNAEGTRIAPWNERLQRQRARTRNKPAKRHETRLYTAPSPARSESARHRSDPRVSAYRATAQSASPVVGSPNADLVQRLVIQSEPKPRLSFRASEARRGIEIVWVERQGIAALPTADADRSDHADLADGPRPPHRAHLLGLRDQRDLRPLLD